MRSLKFQHPILELLAIYKNLEKISLRLGWVFTGNIENIFFNCSFLLANISGMTKTKSDISSTKLFCIGVPVSNSFLDAYKVIRYISKTSVFDVVANHNETNCDNVDTCTFIRFSYLEVDMFLSMWASSNIT